MINFVVRKQRGFTLVEMLLALAVITSLFTVAVFVVHRLYEIPAERSELLASKRYIMEAMNQYFLNNYKEIKDEQRTFQIDKVVDLVKGNFIDEVTFYKPDSFKYEMWAIYNGDNKWKLQLKIIPKNKNDLAILRWLNPDVIDRDKGQAIWYEVPHYKNVAGTIKLNAVIFARGHDNDKF